MFFKDKIKKIAANFPGLLEPSRLNLLNSQLIELHEKGFSKLVDKFLSNKNQYTIVPFLFEVYLCRWLLSQNRCRNMEYEPDDVKKPPEFVFHINDKFFQIEAKVITQLINESVKKKIVSQINRQISSKTKNVIEIWLSENIEPKDINEIVDWISNECISLKMGDKKNYIIEDETLAWVKTIYESNTGGSVGIEHILGSHNGEMQKIDTQNIREKIRTIIKKSNNKFRLRCGEDIFNLIFATCDSSIFLTKETFQEALYGSEAVISYQNENGEINFKEILQDNGIWSKEVYTNIDIILFIKPGTDFIGDHFDPYVFPNPHKIKKLRRIPELFNSMKTHLPPTILGQSIFAY